ncbi:MAG: B12-binding domain-containing radical SAM protein [Nitrospirae bacterium CG_4_9_14_3_um_filter_53_35]|nr:MAG: B12-binding domain-containing radical SAM protein [Nitrospirae bacterium CG_4_9_14_3_um_filter_53_35]
MTEKDLARVSRPSRYIGSEINAVKKDHQRVDIKVVLAFPDAYEIGMSHTGLKILYEILNNRKDTAAERVFAPWKDMEQLLRSEKRPLCSLESGIPLRDFDILGFTLQYEMSYTNILNMLDLAGIPLFSAERDGSFPLIIGGGPCAFNPEPLAGFFDLFVIGDGEEVIGEIVDLFKKYRSLNRETLLGHLAELEGVYVPSDFEILYAPDGPIREIRRTRPGPERIRKRMVKDLNRAPYPRSPLLPYMKIVHDRVALEISRGCTRGCRFCQAGMIYRPVRERDVKTIIGYLKDSVLSTGYEEISLTSLSSGDYTELPRLVKEAVRFSEKRHVSVALPSLRPGTLSSEIIAEIQKIRKTGFTIAPEAGTQRLRDVINKGVTEEDLLTTVQKVFSAGWEILKLYFMIGLPSETEEDVKGITDLTFKALKIAKQANPRFKQIHVSVSPFVPKAHTPFQWSRQNRPEEIADKYQFLKRGFKHKKLSLKWHEPGISRLEGIFSRGDRRLGLVLCEAWRLGCRFDGWTDECDLAKWDLSFQNTGITPDFYLYRERDLAEILPWDHIESGVTKTFLAEEYRQSLKGEITPDCRYGACTLCGACGQEPGFALARSGEETGIKVCSPRPNLPVVKRFRIRYSKGGRLKFLSHLELINTMVRSFARAGIPLEYSHGFHPHPKMAMGPALPVGVSAMAEYLDVNVIGSVFEETLAAGLNQVLPDGIRVTGVNWIPAQAPAISSVIRFGEYLLDLPRSAFREDPSLAVQELMGRHEILITRDQKDRIKTLDIRPMIEEMEIHSMDEEQVIVRLIVQTGDQGGARIDEVLQTLLNQPASNLQDVRITRTGLYTNRYRAIPFQETKVEMAH